MRKISCVCFADLKFTVAGCHNRIATVGRSQMIFRLYCLNIGVQVRGFGRRWLCSRCAGVSDMQIAATVCGYCSRSSYRGTYGYCAHNEHLQ